MTASFRTYLGLNRIFYLHLYGFAWVCYLKSYALHIIYQRKYLRLQTSCKPSSLPLLPSDIPALAPAHQQQACRSHFHTRNAFFEIFAFRLLHSTPGEKLPIILYYEKVRCLDFDDINEGE